jgi:hypothetical protein
MTFSLRRFLAITCCCGQAVPLAAKPQEQFRVVAGHAYFGCDARPRPEERRIMADHRGNTR